jgi:hypothetical protein
MAGWGDAYDWVILQQPVLAVFSLTFSVLGNPIE